MTHTRNSTMLSSFQTSKVGSVSLGKLLSSEKFDAICEYLQQRIGKTIVAELNARTGAGYAELIAKRGSAGVWQRPWRQ